MSTQITKVYSSFLRKLSDYKFSVINEQDREYTEETLYGYYISARAEFVQCRKNLLTNRDGSELYIEAEKIFIEDSISDKEIEILSIFFHRANKGSGHFTWEKREIDGYETIDEGVLIIENLLKKYLYDKLKIPKKEQ